MAEETRYLYTINPKRPIKDIPDLGVIRCPKSYLLSKEEVKLCLKSASVYRRFANESKNVWVTLANLDRLHNEKFMEEDEYNKLCYEKEFGNKGVVIKNAPKVEEPVKAEEPVVAPEVVQPTVDEVADGTSKEESVVETIADETTVEGVEENPEDTEVIADEEVVDEESTEDEEVEEINDEEVEEIEDGDDEAEPVEEKPQPQKQNKKKKH